VVWAGSELEGCGDCLLCESEHFFGGWALEGIRNPTRKNWMVPLRPRTYWRKEVMMIVDVKEKYAEPF